MPSALRWDAAERDKEKFISKTIFYYSQTIPRAATIWGNSRRVELPRPTLGTPGNSREMGEIGGFETGGVGGFELQARRMVEDVCCHQDSGYHNRARATKLYDRTAQGLVYQPTKIHEPTTRTG